MYEDFDERLDSIGGSFSPDQMSVFLNMKMDDLDENYRVYFHEKFHHWQFLFTPYGQLRWGCIRSASSEIIEAWNDAAKATANQWLLPVGNLLKQSNKDSIKHVFNILEQDFALTLLNYQERFYESENVKKALDISREDVCPLITFLGRDCYINGLDIIESFTKFQEAVFCKIVDNTPFLKTVDIAKLNTEYYSALAFFQEQIGSDRILEFPVICEIALSTNKLSKFNKENLSWQDNHPAWRFVKLIRVIKDQSYLLPSLSENIKENFILYWNAVSDLCGFQDYHSMWDSAAEYAQSSELSMAKDMKKAIDFKLRYPWFLAFPFLDGQILENTDLNDFQPYYLLFNDASGYLVEDESQINEIVFEGQYQALSNQILGKMSQRCLYPDMLQCGFSYYGLSGCKYLTDGLCDGYFDINNRIEELIFDDSGNVIQGCPFECFLLASDINPNGICFSNIRDRATFQDFEKKVQGLKAE